MVTPRGNVAGCSCAATYTWQYGYDRDSNQTSETPLVWRTSSTYDAANRWRTRSTATATDPVRLRHDQPIGHRYRPDRVATLGVPTDGQTTYSYDEVGNLKTRTDANAHTTSFTYDLDGRRTQMDAPGAVSGVRSWLYSYDAAGHLTKMVDANGTATTGNPSDGTTQYSFDFAGRLTDFSFSDAPTVHFDLDPAGNRTSLSDGAGNESYAYTDAGRLQSVTRGSNQFAYLYDPNGQVAQRTYPDGTVVGYSYDDDNRMATVTSGPDVINYGYDPSANLTTTALPAANGYLEARTYDPSDRLTEIKNQKGAAVLSKFTLTLDATGNPTRLDKLGANSETYKYNADDQITEACFKASGAACGSATDPFVRWNYDPVGNRLSETRPAGTTNDTFNNADQLAQETAPNPYPNQVATDGAQPYWRLGETSGSSFASNSGTFTGTWIGSPTLGAAGALAGDPDKAVMLNPGATTGQSGAVASAAAMNLTNNFSLELWVKRSKNALLQAVAGKPLTTTSKSENYAIWIDTTNKIRFEIGNGTKNGAVLSAAALDTNWHHIVGTFASGTMKIYVDGALSNTATATFTTAATNTSQFQVGRAGTANDFGGSLDEVAIYPTALTAAQVLDHRTKGSTTPPTTAYSYDQNGNETAKGTRTFVWNVANQLTSTTQSGTTTTYTYDADNKRLSSVSGAATTNYLWDTTYGLPQLALERDGSNNLLRRYLTGRDTLSMTTPTSTSWLQYDNVGSVVNTTNASGVTQWSREYEPYGSKRVETNVSGSAPITPLQYAGEYLDTSNGGLYNLRARQYDPGNGRFLSTDPVAPDPTDPWISPYAYAGDQPTTQSDPSGLDPRIGGNTIECKRNKLLCSYIYGAGYSDSSCNGKCWFRVFASLGGRGITTDMLRSVAVGNSKIVNASDGADGGGLYQVGGGKTIAIKPPPNAPNCGLVCAFGIATERTLGCNSQLSCTAMAATFFTPGGSLGRLAKGVRGLRAAEAGTSLVPKAPFSLGRWGESRLAAELGGAGVKPRSPFKTWLGPRYVDRLVDGVAYEAKAGVNVGLTSSVRRQVLKDADLIVKGQIRGAEWHFFQGAQDDLISFLREHGIKAVVHP